MNIKDKLISFSDQQLKQIAELRQQADMFGMDVDYETMTLAGPFKVKDSHWGSIWDNDQQMSYYYDNMNSEEWEARHGRS